MSRLRRRYFFALGERLVQVVHRMSRSEAMVYAGYLSFLTFLGIVPALAVAYWLSQQSEFARIAEQSLRAYLSTHVFPETAGAVVAQITKLRLNARTLGVTALILLAVDVLFKVYALHGAIRRICDNATRWWSPMWLMIVGLVFVPLTVASLVWGLQFLETFFAHLMPKYKRHIDWLFVPLQVSLPLWAALAVFYRCCVPTRLGTRECILVAAVAMLAIEAVRLFLTGYFSSLAQVRSLYGTFSAIPVMMISVFLSWLIVLAGVAWLARNSDRGIVSR